MTHPTDQPSQPALLPDVPAKRTRQPRAAKAVAAPLTTAQQLGSLIKSARDIMRKDKGLNGDLDRLPMLTWIMFLKFLDDQEQIRVTEAELQGRAFHPAIAAPYRWRDWATDDSGISGDDLIAFINNDEAQRPDGTRGPGLFAYLRGLDSGGADRQRVIATVFRGTINRMINGYLLRDVINKIAGIHFSSSTEMHTLGHLYESLLKEMRDAAGDSGEFYTPRAVVRFMVAVTDPRLGEIVLDPACGTGGFLVEAYSHLAAQCHTVEDQAVVQTRSIVGGEAKSLPYLLAQMNLLLHGLEAPRIDPGNSLRTPLAEIGDPDRVDVILTNPPFGGEEEAGIQNNFPADKRTSETALLFLQLIMRKLRRTPKPGRAAVVVPNGVLYSSGVASRIRRKLIEEFNLHTVVRLPKGVFEPYADILTNILFFDTAHATTGTWFYQHPLPPHRAHMRSPSYSQSDPLQFEEFSDILEWWNNRVENQYAWKMSTENLKQIGYQLDLQRPLSNNERVINLESFEERINTHISSIEFRFQELQSSLKMLSTTLNDLDIVVRETETLGNLCNIIKGNSPTQKTRSGEYKFVVTASERRTADTYQFDEAVVCVPMVSSTGHGHASVHRIHYEEGKFALANIMAALIVKPKTLLLPKYLYYYLWAFKELKLVRLMSGTANTSLSIDKLRTVQITYPSDLNTQHSIVDALDNLLIARQDINSWLTASHELSEDALSESLSACFRRHHELTEQS